MKGGMPYADAALARRDAFVQVCLLAQRQDGKAGPPDAEQSLKVSFVQQLTACVRILVAGSIVFDATRDFIA